MHAPEAGEVARGPQDDQVLRAVQEGGEAVDALDLLLLVVLRDAHAIQKAQALGAGQRLADVLPEEQEEDADDLTRAVS